MQGRRVVVLGGYSAMDCNRTAIRPGAESVTCTYRHDEARMPGSRRDYKNSREAGVELLFNRQLAAIKGEHPGHVTAVRLVHRPGPRVAKPIEGSEHVVPADAVILAFGFHPSPPAWSGTTIGCTVSRIRVCGSAQAPFQTTHPKVFAGGNRLRSSGGVVTMAFEGREAGRRSWAASEWTEARRSPRRQKGQ
jgi:glutamate synthase (NADPH/NADH) small chain